ncbi:MAG: hypothetical protein HDT40_07135 [Lachnospiraceae bacterium]|nr:hypothetical protein [Lachnospiraceae bacterium]
MKKILYLGVTFLAFFCISAFSIISHARKNTLDLSYGDTGITLRCYINCTNSYGEGSTDWAQTYKYRNYIKVITYDINQNSLGYKESYSSSKASEKVSTGNPYLTRTYHAAADSNGQLLPVNEQRQQAQCRDD